MSTEPKKTTAPTTDPLTPPSGSVVIEDGNRQGFSRVKIEGRSVSQGAGRTLSKNVRISGKRISLD